MRKLDPSKLDLAGITAEEAGWIQEKVDAWRLNKIWELRCQVICDFLGVPMEKEGGYLFSIDFGEGPFTLSKGFVDIVEHVMEKNNVTSKVG